MRLAAVSLFRPGRRRAVRLRADDHARPRFLHALDDDPVAGLQTLLDNPALFDALAGDDAARHYLVVGSHRQHRLEPLQLPDRLLRDKDRVLLFAASHSHAAELTGENRVLRVGKRGLHLERAGPGVYVVDRVLETTVVGMYGVVGQDQLQW